jgi:hypothetical protein
MSSSQVPGSPPSEDNAPVRVVCSKNGVTYRYILEAGQYNLLETGQIELPDGYSSSGYWERLTGSVWGDLPYYNPTAVNQ